MYCPKCDTPNADRAKVCRACGAPLPDPNSVSYTPGVNRHFRDYPMKWFSFLIYFQLFLSAAVNVIDGILNLAGIKSSLGLLRIPMGIFSILMGFYAVFIRFSLAAYRRQGPTHFKVFLILVTLSQTILSLLTGGISGGLASLITNGIYMAINFSYFNKRQELFIY